MSDLLRSVPTPQTPTSAAAAPAASASGATNQALAQAAATLQQAAQAFRSNTTAGAPSVALPLPGGSTVQLPLSLAQYLAWAGDANITEILVTNLVLETTIPDGSTSWGIQLPVPADTQLLSFSDWIAEADYYTESATARPWINYGTQQWTAIPTQVSPGIFAGTIGPPQQGALSKGNAGTIGASSTVPLQVVGQHEIPGDLTLVYTNASGIDITAALSGVFAFIPAAVWKTYFEPLRQGLEQIWRAFGPDLKAAGE